MKLMFLNISLKVLVTQNKNCIDLKGNVKTTPKCKYKLNISLKRSYFKQIRWMKFRGWYFFVNFFEFFVNSSTQIKKQVKEI